MRKALRSRAGYDWDTHKATRQRNREQIATIPPPQYPACGTARIGRLVAEARRRRDEALLAAHARGGASVGAAVPLDNMIPSAAPAATPTPTPVDRADRVRVT